MLQHSPWLASRGAKLSRRKKCWTRRVVEHSVLASTIVSLEFLNLSVTSIWFGRFLVCRPRTPFLLDRCTFVSGTYGIGGVRVKPFSCARNLVERQAQLLLDSLYVDHV